MKLIREILNISILLISSFLFIIAILCFNSEGTTWGSGPAVYGLFFIIPSFFVMLKYSNFKMLTVHRGIIFCTALGGLIITVYAFVDTKIKSKSDLLTDGPTQFYPPDLNFQLIGLFFIFYIFYVIFFKFPKKKMAEKI